ncbi:MAG: DUF4439 domain-containing protein [Sneathiellaceae bacterium]
MSQPVQNQIPAPIAGPAPARRRFLQGAGTATLSAGAMALLIGCESMAAKQGMAADPGADAALLNGAIGLEDQAIGAYQLALESGLLTAQVRPVATLFQSHHQAHREALAATVTKLGGSPQGPKPLASYAAALDAGSLKDQADVLELALRLEREAADGYLKAIPDLRAEGLGQVSARIAADEVLHWTVIQQALGRPLPAKALTFGA